MPIDRGDTLIDFEEHENVIAHASSEYNAVRCGDLPTIRAALHPPPAR
jgi:hypothetical protein